MLVLLVWLSCSWCFSSTSVFLVWKHLTPEQSDLKAEGSSFLKMQFPKSIYTYIFLFVLFSTQWSQTNGACYNASLITVFKVLSVEVMHC